MDKDFDEFLKYLNSEDARETQDEIMRQTLSQYAEDGVITSGEGVMTAAINAARNEAVCVLAAYHAWFHDGGQNPQGGE